MSDFVKQNESKGEYNGFLVNIGGVLQEKLKTKLLK